MTRTRHRFFVLLLMAILALGLAGAWGAGIAAAADNSACFACHGTESSAPSQTIAGKTVSLYVNPAAFATTKHGGRVHRLSRRVRRGARQGAAYLWQLGALRVATSTDTSATWNFWKVSGDKCVACHTDPWIAKFFTSDHSTAWNMMYNPDGTPREEVDVGTDGVTYHTNEDYTEANCGRCHMQKNCATCHWKTPIRSTTRPRSRLGTSPTSSTSGPTSRPRPRRSKLAWPRTPSTGRRTSRLTTFVPRPTWNRATWSARRVTRASSSRPTPASPRSASSAPE